MHLCDSQGNRTWPSFNSRQARQRFETNITLYVSYLMDCSSTTKPQNMTYVTQTSGIKTYILKKLNTVIFMEQLTWLKYPAFYHTLPYCLIEFFFLYMYHTFSIYEVYSLPIIFSILCTQMLTFLRRKYRHYLRLEFAFSIIGNVRKIHKCIPKKLAKNIKTSGNKRLLVKNIKTSRK